jgi:hypothetical protein
MPLWESNPRLQCWSGRKQTARPLQSAVAELVKKYALSRWIELIRWWGVFISVYATLRRTPITWSHKRNRMQTPKIKNWDDVILIQKLYSSNTGAFWDLSRFFQVPLGICRWMTRHLLVGVGDMFHVTFSGPFRLVPWICYHQQYNTNSDTKRLPIDPSLNIEQTRCLR